MAIALKALSSVFLLLIITSPVSSSFIFNNTGQEDGLIPAVEHSMDEGLMSIITCTITLEISYSEGFVQGPDKRYHFDKLENGAYQRGQFGEVEQFIIFNPGQRGRINIISTRFEGSFLSKYSPVPYIIPSVVSSSETFVDSSWEGSGSVEASRHIDLISKSDSDHLKIFPISIYDGKVECASKIIIEFSLIEDQDLFTRSPGGSRKPVGQTKYLIVTTDGLRETVEPLAIWKSRKGIFTSIVTIEDLRREYPAGNDPKRIRDHIQSLEATNDLDYVLLVGDYDRIPTRNTMNLHPEQTYGEPVTFASDGYYACIDQGSTWNSDGDGNYLESGELDDAFPDLALGRLAINNREVLEGIIDDIIDREKEPQWEDHNDVPLHIVGDPSTVPGQPIDTMTYFWTEYLDDILPSRETMHYDGTGTKSFGPNGFRSSMGEGHQTIGYFSHGTQTGIPNLYTNNQIPSLPQNGREGLFFLMACLTGWFDDPNQGSMGSFTDCFGEYMTETPGKGVSGYIGSSRLAVGSIDTAYNGDAPGLEEDFWRGVREAYLGNIKPTNGDIYRYAIDHFATSFYPFPTSYVGYSAQRTFLEYNLLGEPESPIYLREPQNLTLEILLEPELSRLSANVTYENGTPAKNALVSVFRWKELGVSARTDDDGHVVIVIPDSNGGTVNVSAYIPGDNLAYQTIDLLDRLEPEALFSIDPEEPDGWNSTYISVPMVKLFGDEKVEIEYQLNNGVRHIISDNGSIPMPEGNNNIIFRARDMTGKWSTSKNVSIEVDLTPPELKCMTDPPTPDGIDNTFISRTNVELTFPETYLGVRYRKNDGYLSHYSRPIELDEGKNEIYFEAYDTSGIFNSSTFHFKMDLSRPYSNMTLSHLPDGDNGYYITRPMIHLRGWDENDAIVRYRWNGGNWTNFSIPIYPDEGINHLEYMAIDRSGNFEPIINKQTFRYDPQAPNITYQISPSEPDGENETYITPPTVTISFEENVDSTIHSQYVLAVPGYGIDWGNDSLPFSSVINIPEGEWLLYVMAIDSAGNREVISPLSFKVDLTIPILEWHVEPVKHDGNRSWYWSRPVIIIDMISADSEAFLSIDGSTFHRIDETHNLPSGVHSIKLYASDRSGNSGPVFELDYKSDTDDPISELTSSRRSFFVNSTIKVFAFNSSDENGISAYMFHVNGKNATLWNRDPNWTYVHENPGNITISVSSMDPSGRISTSDPLHLEIISLPAAHVENDTGINIDDPTGDTNVTSDSVSFDHTTFIKIAAGILIIMIIALVVILYGRKKEISEVDWTDDGDWLDEDWVDLDIDDEDLEGYSLDGFE